MRKGKVKVFNFLRKTEVAKSEASELSTGKGVT